MRSNCRAERQWLNETRIRAQLEKRRLIIGNFQETSKLLLMSAQNSLITWAIYITFMFAMDISKIYRIAGVIDIDCCPGSASFV
jgi:hypothetical protein